MSIGRVEYNRLFLSAETPYLKELLRNIGVQKNVGFWTVLQKGERADSSQSRTIPFKPVSHLLAGMPRVLAVPLDTFHVMETAGIPTHFFTHWAWLIKGGTITTSVGDFVILQTQNPGLRRIIDEFWAVGYAHVTTVLKRLNMGEDVTAADHEFVRLFIGWQLTLQHGNHLPPSSLHGQDWKDTFLDLQADYEAAIADTASSSSF